LNSVHIGQLQVYEIAANGNHRLGSEFERLVVKIGMMAT